MRVSVKGALTVVPEILYTLLIEEIFSNINSYPLEISIKLHVFFTIVIFL